MTKFSLLSAIGGLATLAAVANAHVYITKPVPYEWFDVSSNMNPLINVARGTAGSDYPCKKPLGATLEGRVVEENHITVGQTYPLVFGTPTTHGGGMCQLSVALDRDPDHTTPFKVIKTWLGGCPIDSNDNVPAVPLDWQMPMEVPDGQWTLAWTWIPRMGEVGETYMNCFPITVAGGARDQTKFQNLPDVYTPNLPHESCGKNAKTNNIIIVPNPGAYTVAGPKNREYSAATGAGCAALAGPGAKPTSPSKGADGAPPVVTPPADSSSATSTFMTTAPPSNTRRPPPNKQNGAPSAIVNKGKANAGDGISNVVADSTQTPPLPGSSAVATKAGSPPLQTLTPINIPNAGPVAVSAELANSSCPVDGKIVCYGATQFALCNHGKTGTWLAVAAGTECADGNIRVTEAYKNLGKGKGTFKMEKKRTHLEAHVHGHALQNFGGKRMHARAF